MKPLGLLALIILLTALLVQPGFAMLRHGGGVAGRGHGSGFLLLNEGGLLLLNAGGKVILNAD